MVYHVPAVRGIRRCRDPSVRPYVCPTWPRRSAHRPGQLGAQRLGQDTAAVRTADPSAHGRRSAAIGGGISSRRAITSFNYVMVKLFQQKSILEKYL